MPSSRNLGLQAAIAVVVTVAIVWAATQWAAAMLGQQPALGAPWFSLGGVIVYAPWKLFAWWVAFDAQAPQVFRRAGLLALAGGIAPALIAIGGAAWRSRANTTKTTYGSARWADLHDVRDAGLLVPRGVVLGLFDDAYLRHDGPEHVLAVAPTRSGKGVGLVLPTLLSWPGSAVVHDIKGENWQLTAGWRASFSTCLLFDPTNPASTRFNPLLEVRKGDYEVRDAQNIADILVDPEGARDRRDHWEKTAHALLTGAILHVLYAEPDKTLHRVATFLADPARSIERTLRIMLSTNHLGTDTAPMVHPVVASVARELLNKSENERSGVVSTAMSLLGLYRDPIVAGTTESSDWRIGDLVNPARPVSLYLVVPPSDISRTRPLVRLILNQIARRLTEKLEASSGAAPPARQLLLMLDEFPALGRLEFFETALTFLAGYGVRAVLVAQSLNQIEKAYGPNNAILDNCHVRVAFAPNDERTAKRLSEALGTMTEQRAQRNLAGHRLSPWLSHLAVSSQETPRPLLTPGEVLQLPADEALVLVSGTPPIRARKLTYFTDRNFTERCLPPPRLVRAADGKNARRAAEDWSGSTRSVDARLEQPWSDLVSSAGRAPELVAEQERTPQLPGTSDADLDLLRDDDGSGPSIAAGDEVVAARAIDDDDLAPAL